VLNTDASLYGGGNVGNLGGVYTEPIPMHGHAQSISIRMPPLGMVVMKPQG
jgi:1,4-alpha-glucan branching enzyme